MELSTESATELTRLSALGVGSSVNQVFNEHGKGEVQVRSIRRQYLELSILVHTVKGGRYQADYAGECMKLLSASFLIASTYEKVVQMKRSVMVGDVTIPDFQTRHYSTQTLTR